ncbi:hypothetical protein [Thalassotalea agarivorans]|uniref:Uncharacterized protein n=1 Tax=Thalassotalea agarivorans TaxID=349064 RepID=A0A1I0GM47_THASX|nr:hypothetical protein [Thalassotalea agarivorans]SET71299.1 hypothetical protein SAMN05660429_02473 [Thalassotalea agarivorans]
MSESYLIIYSLGCMLLGHFTAYFFKNLQSIWERYGVLIGGFFIFTVGLTVLLYNAMVADMQNSVLSIAVALGFCYRFFAVRD